MKGKYKSEVLAALHETASGLYKTGLMSEDDMRFYDEGCLVKSAPEAERASSQKPQSGTRPAAPAYARGK
ncbi:MAG: hypothetical protein LBD07_04335 [Spirochaetaceae bacterium]|jgi:putative transcriptional regulator|nr:hypothetical protein [Spirochaetaceae bacterium]